MQREYKIKCKLCGDILQAQVPTKDEITCSCRNLSIYSDYIGYGKVKHLPAEECYENLSKPITQEELEEYFKEVDK